METHNDIHSHYHWEYSIAPFFSKIYTSDKSAFGARAQLIKRFGNMKRLRFGLGAGMIFDEFKHYKGNAILIYEFSKALTISYNPGVVLIQTKEFTTEGPNADLVEKKNINAQFGQHFELMYEFEFNHIHTGPLLRYGLSKFGANFGFGLNIAFDFDVKRDGIMPGPKKGKGKK